MAVLTTTGRAEGLWGTSLLFEGLSSGGGGDKEGGLREAREGGWKRSGGRKNLFLKKL